MCVHLVIEWNSQKVGYDLLASQSLASDPTQRLPNEWEKNTHIPIEFMDRPWKICVLTEFNIFHMLWVNTKKKWEILKVSILDRS